MQATLLRRSAASASYTLASGAQIPKIGFGTWKLKPDETLPAVSQALKHGFRHIDSAWAYKNEEATGKAIADSGVSRKDVFLTSKLWNTFHGDNVEKGLDATLRDLGTDYLDLYLMHWPVAFANPKGSELSSLKSQDGRPIENHILSQDIVQTWKNMEQMVKKGKVRNIGISNFNIRRVDLLLQAAEIKPVANQVEVSWGVPNNELIGYCQAHNIQIQAWSPLGSSDYIEEYIQDPVVQDVASRNNMTPIQALLAWHFARGINPITRSRHADRLQEILGSLEKELPFADVQHLTKEAENKPIQRVVDPTEAWNVKEDIFEDGVDQTRSMSLKGDNFEVPLPHEHASSSSSTASSSYLEPRNDPAADNKPSETVARFHSLAGNRTTGTKGSTVIQQLMKRRGFSSMVRSRSPVSSKKSSSSSSSTRAASTIAVAPSPSPAAEAEGLTVAGPGSLPKTPKAVRVFPARKAFLYDQYSRLMKDSQFMFFVQPNNLSAQEAIDLRHQINSVPLPEGMDGYHRARLTHVRTAVFRRVVKDMMKKAGGKKKGKGATLVKLLPVLTGPVSMLTCPSFSPSYVSKLLTVIDRAFGNRSVPKAAAAGEAHSLTATLNHRLVPLAAFLEGNKLVMVPSLRDASQLPDLPELRTQLAGLISAPASQLASTLSMASGAQLYLTLEARKRQLDEESSSSSSSSAADTSAEPSSSS